MYREASETGIAGKHMDAARFPSISLPTMKHRIIAVLVLVTAITGTGRAQESELTVDQIMQAPETWIGAWPS